MVAFTPEALPAAGVSARLDSPREEPVVALTPPVDVAPLRLGAAAAWLRPAPTGEVVALERLTVAVLRLGAVAVEVLRLGVVVVVAVLRLGVVVAVAVVRLGVVVVVAVLRLGVVVVVAVVRLGAVVVVAVLRLGVVAVLAVVAVLRLLVELLLTEDLVIELEPVDAELAAAAVLLLLEGVCVDSVERLAVEEVEEDDLVAEAAVDLD